MWASWVAALLALTPAAAHRGLTRGPSCDEDFGLATTALQVPDPKISWAFDHYLDCTHRAVWTKFTNPEADFKFYVGVGIPPVTRFAALRADAVIIGPGLPALSAAEQALLPAEVRDSPVWNGQGIGGILHRSPQDQSTCAHLGKVMNDSSSVRNGRCDFFEPWGKTNSWRVLDADENVIPNAGAEYHVAVWFQQHQSGKLGIALGTWVENFITPIEIPVPTCQRTLGDFSEKLGAQDLCLPVTSCPPGTPIPRKTDCIVTRACSADAAPSSCEDTLSTNAMCTWGGMCDCAVVTQSNPCGSTMKSAMGDTVINTVCAKTCSACDSSGAYTMSMGCGGKACPQAARLWDKVNMDMHKGMAISFTCDAGLDFVRGMIPHHNGAVAMCDVLLDELSCATDGGMDGLVHFCQHVKSEQEREVTGMRDWLATKNLGENASCPSQMGQMGQMTTTAQMDHSSGHDHDHDHDHSADHGSDHSADMPGMSGSMSMGCGNTTCTSTQAFIKANSLMHMSMAADLGCNHQVDFARMMLPHHAGAVVMCEVLADASYEDDYLTQLCANITRVQRAEVAWLADWLAARDHPLAAGCCQAGQAQVQPEKPCEDTLPASSFCHMIGGDYYCSCEAVVAQQGCTTAIAVSGFGSLEVSSECKRSCDLCPAKRELTLGERCSGSGMVESSGAMAKRATMAVAALALAVLRS